MIDHICHFIDISLTSEAEDQGDEYTWFHPETEQTHILLGARAKLHEWQANTRFNLSRTSRGLRYNLWPRWLANTTFVFTVRPGHFGHPAANAVLFPNDSEADIKPVHELLANQLQGLYKLTPDPGRHMRRVSFALPDRTISLRVENGKLQSCDIHGHPFGFGVLKDAVGRYAFRANDDDEGGWVDWEMVVRFVCFVEAASRLGCYHDEGGGSNALEAELKQIADGRGGEMYGSPPSLLLCSGESETLQQDRGVKDFWRRKLTR